MSMWTQTAKAAGGDYEICPAGNEPGVLIGIIDLGTHDEEMEDQKTGKKKTVSLRKLYFIWEMVECSKSGQKNTNHLMARSYSLSLGPNAALRKMIEGWRGIKMKEGDPLNIKELLGKAFMIEVVHGESANTGKTYAKINAVGSVPKKMSVSDPLRKPFCWSFDDDTDLPDLSWVPYIFGEKVEDYIGRSKEAKRLRADGGSGSSNATDDDFDKF